MAFAWFLVVIAALVSTRVTNKLKRAKKAQEEGDYVPVDDSDTESEDWDKLTEEAEKAAAAKDKAQAAAKRKTSSSAAEKGKAPMEHTPMKKKSVARKRGRAQGIEIEEPLDSAPPPKGYVQINTERIKDFEHRECIGERHVNIGALRERSETFGRLVDRAQLSPICKFPETSGYCLHLVRTFYLCANQLQDCEDGVKEFHTTIRNTKITATPHLIGEVLGMSVQTDGTHYMKGKVLTNDSWRIVVDGICLPETRSAGNSVFSKELKEEYRFLNFIVCYNILPNMQTKVLRWDRMLFLYLLGHPSAARGLNINIPFLIWSRMARYVENAHPTERLPFPLIIMRIFKKFDVDIGSSTYMHSLGTINDSTIVKSLSAKPDETPSPPRRKRPSTSKSQQATAPPTVPPAVSRQPVFETSDDDASISSIYREQQRLSSEQERLSIEQVRISHELQTISAAQTSLKRKFNSVKKLLKKLVSKMGCSSSDGSDSE